MKSLLVIEHQNQQLNASNASVAKAAQCFGADYDAIVIGPHSEKVAAQVAKLSGCQTVWLAEHTVYEYQMPENVAPLIATLAHDYQAILAPASTFGKNLMPRLAALLDVNCISDVMTINSHQHMIRPMYAGHIHATIQSMDWIKIVTIRANHFAAVSEQKEPAIIKPIETIIENNQAFHVSLESHASSRPDLITARVVIGGGRGLKEAKHFQLIERLADVLGGAVGATRAAVDAGYMPNDYQVGQTGKVIAPELYIAVGVSGAVQHIAGIQESRVIVAINQDPDAPIFKVADYGIVGDLFTIVPELIQVLTALKQSP